MDTILILTTALLKCIPDELIDEMLSNCSSFKTRQQLIDAIEELLSPNSSIKLNSYTRAELSKLCFRLSNIK